MVVKRTWRRVLRGGAWVDEGVLSRLWEDPDGLVASGTPVKEGDRTTIVRVGRGEGPGGEGGGAWILKRFNRKGALHTTVHAGMRLRAAWCWRNAARLEAAGIRTARAGAMLEERFGPLRGRSFFLSEAVEGRPLLDAARDAGLDETGLRGLATRFGEIWRRLGEARMAHGDMKATNFIVEPDGGIAVIDLDGMRRVAPGPWWTRSRAKDRRRFLRNWEDPSVNPATALAFRDAIERASGRGG